MEPTIHPPVEQARSSSHAGRKFPLFELLLVMVCASASTFALARDHYARKTHEASFFARHGLAELGPLVAKYGGTRYSRNMEELVIRDFFQDRRDGVFLDVGANHYQLENNTYFLESRLGWSGVAIDALPEFGPDYVKHRPKTKFVAMFAADVTDRTVTFFVPKHNKLVASSSHDFTVREGEPGEARQVPTTTLNAVLDQAGIRQIDFMSMDIELSEPKALAGFDIDRFQPSLVCIEAHPDVRQQILDYFAEHRYVVLGKYLRIDPNNLYFAPMAGSR
jgi:FkbM family methyltransferase